MDARHPPTPARGTESIFTDDFESPPPIVELPPFAVRVLNKCAYGPKPGDVAAFNALGANDDVRLATWLDLQLDPDTINDGACDNRLSAANYVTANLALPQLWAEYVRGASNSGSERYWPCDEAACIKLVRAVYTIEIVEPLGRKAAQALLAAGYMVSLFGAIPFTDALVVRYIDDRMRSRVTGVRLAISFGVSSAAVWALGPFVKAAGFDTLLLTMAGISLFTVAFVLYLPSEPPAEAAVPQAG